jgi:sugar lactone lactonase YvrE
VPNRIALGIGLSMALLLAGCATSGGSGAREDVSFEGLVWPPPPDKARIKLEEVIAGRIDVEAKSKFRRQLTTSAPQSPYDWLRKPFAVAIDSRGRILVTDSGSSSLIRFDRKARRMDVLGVRSTIRLQLPMGLAVGPDDVVYVADATFRAVVAFDPDSNVQTVYGRQGELLNPTDVAVSPDATELFVADSKAHKIVVFDLATREVKRSFGSEGVEPGQFRFPTSLSFSPEGDLFVVDQLNARVQIFDPEGVYLDQLGGRGVAFGNFVRPKDVVVDEIGLVYVVDNAFNNLQIFDQDLTLLTFVGQMGSEPGQFLGASGVAVRGQELAVVDQLGHRLQIFRFLETKDQELVAEVSASRQTPSPRVSPVVEAESAPADDAPIAELAASPPAIAESGDNEADTAIEAPAEPESASLPAPTSPSPPGIEPSTPPHSVSPPATESHAAAAPPLTESQIRSQVTGVVFDWYESWVDGRPQDHLDLYSQDFHPPSGTSRADWEQTRRDAIQRSAGVPSNLEYRLEEFDQTAAAVRLIGGPGGEGGERLLVLMREGDEWRIHVEAIEEP